MTSLSRLLLCLLTTFLLVGCGSTGTDDIAQNFTNTVTGLPPHVKWNTYNVYRFQNGAFAPVISRGILQENVTLGDQPVFLVHGLGGNIRDGDFAPMAQFLLQNNLATDVYGFEYDSLDSVATNGAFFRTAMDVLTGNGAQLRTWDFIGHSMGGLVLRAAIQAAPLPMAASGNRVITLGTPHFGSPVANAIQDNTDIQVRTSVLLLLNQGGFTNVDFQPSAVNVEEPGFFDLRTDSPFLNFLNQNIANHAQVDYYTIAGTKKGQYELADNALGVSTDDGLVTVASANPPQLGALGSALVPVSHTELDEDPTLFPLIGQFLTQ